MRERGREGGREGEREGGREKGGRIIYVVTFTKQSIWLTVCVASCTMAQGSSSTVTTNVERACRRFAPMTTVKAAGEIVNQSKWMRWVVCWIATHPPAPPKAFYQRSAVLHSGTSRRAAEQHHPGQWKTPPNPQSIHILGEGLVSNHTV